MGAVSTRQPLGVVLNHISNANTVIDTNVLSVMLNHFKIIDLREVLVTGWNKDVRFVILFYRLLKNVVISIKARVVYVATDKDPMIAEIKEHLKNQKVMILFALLTLLFYGGRKNMFRLCVNTVVLTVIV